MIEFKKTSLATEYWELYRDKFQRAFSVGFMSVKTRDDLKDGKRITVHTEVELFEISCVPIPSNRETLSRSAKRKRDFIASKRRLETAEDCKIDQWGKRLDLWDDTPEAERKELFTLEEIVEFSRMDTEAEKYAELIYNEKNELSAGLESGSGSGDVDDDLEAEQSPEARALVHSAVGEDYKENTGSLVELALGV